MTITHQVEEYKTCIDDIVPLFYNHWKEVANNQDTVPLDPDFDRYKALEDQGMMRIFTVRSGIDRTLIGYFISFISPHMHYKSTVYAINDILYMDPQYRGGTQAYRMMRGAIEDLRDNCNVDRLVIHMKVDHEFRRLMKSLGGTLTEENWEVQL